MKNVIYRFLQSPKIDWMHFITVLSKQIIAQLIPLTLSTRQNAFIIDDSIYDHNRSRKLELLSKVYDHAKHIYGFGYQMFTLGWSDGTSFVPINFCLMSSTDRTNQLNHERTHSSHAARRPRELAQQKVPNTATTLLASAKASGIKGTHVLIDSWFSFPEMIHQVFQSCL